MTDRNFEIKETPVYDLREWDANHFQMSRGITLTKDELSILREKLQEVEL